MADTGKPVRKPSRPASRLSDQIHNEVMDLLQLGEKSEYPEIRATAIKLAEEKSKHHHRQEAKVSPNVVLILVIGLGIGVAAVCCYAFLHFPSTLAWEISSFLGFLYLVLVGALLFLSDKLTQSNFMKILGWFATHLKSNKGSKEQHADLNDSA